MVRETNGTTATTEAPLTGGVDDIPELTIEVLKLLTSIAEREGLRSCKFVKKPSPGKGDGYMGILTRIEISGTDTHKERVSLHIIIKAATTSTQMRDNAPVKLAYDRESYMYNSIFPAFQKFQHERNIGLPFDGVVKCYVTSSKDFDECLVMADLKELGYTLKDCKTAMDEKHISLVFAEYAKFHAVGFAFKDQKPDLFQSLTGDWEEAMQKFFEMPDTSEMFKLQTEKAMEALDPIKYADVRDRLQKFADEALDIVMNAVRPGEVAPYDTIGHGDCWNNNMMFKYCEETHAPLKVCLLDFQIARVGSPVLDLSYFFYACAGKKAMDNLDYHLNSYYEQLSKRIRELGSNPDVVYPKSEFLSQWNKYCQFGLAMAMILLHMVTSDKSEVPDLPSAFESGKGILEAFVYDSKNVKEFHARVKDVILHHYERKYI